MAETRRHRTAGKAWPKRGEIYLTALDPTIGHEIQETRPALIIQNDTSNRLGATIMVAPITPIIRLPLSPVHVLLPAGGSSGLTVASVAVFDLIQAVDRSRLIKRLGSVDRLVMSQVNEAIMVAFGLSAADEGSVPDEGTDPGPTITRAISESSGNIRTGRYEG